MRIYLYTFILTFVFSFFLFFPWNKKIYEEERMVTYYYQAHYNKLIFHL